MKIYFSQVPHEDIDTFGDEGLLGPNAAGDFFYNQVEFGTNPGGIDEVAISDGCDRYMPISVDNIPELIDALLVFYNTKTELDLRNTLLAVVESNAEGYVDDDHIHFDRESVQKVIDSGRLLAQLHTEEWRLVTLDFLVFVRDLANKDEKLIETYGEAFDVLQYLEKAKVIELEPAEEHGAYKIRKRF